MLVADHAYAPYARRKPAVVADRLGRLGQDVVSQRAPKLVVLASAQGCADALDELRARLAPLPVIGIDGIVPQASARSAAGRVALLTGAGCLRGAQLARALKRERGGGLVSWSQVPGLREAVEGGGDAGPAIAAELAQLAGAGVDAIALGCPARQRRRHRRQGGRRRAGRGRRQRRAGGRAGAAAADARRSHHGRRRPGRRVLVSIESGGRAGAACARRSGAPVCRAGPHTSRARATHAQLLQQVVVKRVGVGGHDLQRPQELLRLQVGGQQSRTRARSRRPPRSTPTGRPAARSCAG